MKITNQPSLVLGIWQKTTEQNALAQLHKRLDNTMKTNSIELVISTRQKIQSNENPQYQLPPHEANEAGRIAGCENVKS